MNLLGDLSSQLASAEAAAAAARNKAEHMLKQARVVAPQHRLARHDNVLLSAHAAFEPDSGFELLSDSELHDAARLARDSMSLFPLRVNRIMCRCRRHVTLTRLLQEAAYLLAR